jgi:hypothetical protein
VVVVVVSSATVTLRRRFGILVHERHTVIVRARIDLRCVEVLLQQLLLEF